MKKNYEIILIPTFDRSKIFLVNETNKLYLGGDSVNINSHFQNQVWRARYRTPLTYRLTAEPRLYLYFFHLCQSHHL